MDSVGAESPLTLIGAVIGADARIACFRIAVAIGRHALL